MELSCSGRRYASALATCLVVGSLASLPASAGDVEIVSHERMIRLERNGVKQYRRGNYAKAFEHLGESARWGLKQSQYLLGFMFLKGQHVPQSTVLGMGWLGVAVEAEVREWSETFDAIYAAAPEELQQRIDAKVTEYVEKFGVQAQRISCELRPELGSRRMRAECAKTPGVTTPWYELELREEPGPLLR